MLYISLMFIESPVATDFPVYQTGDVLQSFFFVGIASKLQSVLNEKNSFFFFFFYFALSFLHFLDQVQYNIVTAIVDEDAAIETKRRYPVCKTCIISMILFSPIISHQAHESCTFV